MNNANAVDDGSRFKREIIFTTLPITGWFRYNNIFQILPADLKGMPQTKVAHKHHPIILEYWYTTDELKKVKVEDRLLELADLHRLTTVSFNKRDLFTSLLSLVTTHKFFDYDGSDSRWGFPLFDEENPAKLNSASSKWCLEMFHWPELPDQLKISSFSENDNSMIASIPWQWYYMVPTFDWNLEGKIDSFPNLTESFLDAYFGKDENVRRVLDSAIASSNSAMEFMSSRKKLSLISAFTAIETMVNLDTAGFKPGKCQACGQETFKVSARYREFLLKYIGDSKSNKKKFNNYYNLRSKIVHTGQDFQTEKLFADVDEKVAMNICR